MKDIITPPHRIVNRILQQVCGIVDLEARKLGRARYQNDSVYLISDPRIFFIKKLINLVSVYKNEINKNNFPAPYAFKLKRLDDWLAPTSAEYLLSQMSWHCNVSCIFCYQKGNPQNMRYKYRMSKEEIETRLKYYNGENGILAGALLEVDESLTNPQIEKILFNIRSKNENLIEISTNGSTLNYKTVKMLKKAKPIMILVSLNSANPCERRKIMNDPRPEVAIRGIKLLKKHKLAYVVSIVAWPGISLKDVENTIKYADENNAYYIRIILPGYSKYFSKDKIFERDKYWWKVINYIRKIRKEYRTPINVSFEYAFAENKEMGLPLILGVIKNSPSFFSGIKAGDLIRRINGKVIQTDEEALAELNGLEKRKAKIMVERRGRRIGLYVDGKKSGYPFLHHENYERSSAMGIILRSYSAGMNTPKLDDINDIKRHILTHGAKNAIVFTSKLFYPLLKFYMEKLGIFKIENVDVELSIVKNAYFGGTIDSADLFTVNDIIKAVKRKLKRKKADLIILPGTFFNHWGRDLTGKLNLYIERETGVPVEFVYSGKD